MNKRTTCIAYIDIDGDPPDPTNAISMVRVEIGDESSTVDDFLGAYYITVCTEGHIQGEMRKHGFWRSGPVLVVECFSDETVIPLIQSSIDWIEKEGIPV